MVFFIAVVGHASHPSEVGTGGKAPTSGLQNNYAHPRVGFQSFKGGANLSDQLIVKGIVLVRIIQSNGGNTAAIRFRYYHLLNHYFVYLVGYIARPRPHSEPLGRGAVTEIIKDCIGNHGSMAN
jgi:hypothetical protein